MFQPFKAVLPVFMFVLLSEGADAKLQVIKINFGKPVSNKQVKVARQVDSYTGPVGTLTSDGNVLSVNASTALMPPGSFTASAASETYCPTETRKNLSLQLSGTTLAASGPVSLPGAFANATDGSDQVSASCSQYFPSPAGHIMAGNMNFECVGSSWQMSGSSCGYGCAAATVAPPATANASTLYNVALPVGASGDSRTYACSTYLTAGAGGTVSNYFTYACENEQWVMKTNGCSAAPPARPTCVASTARGWNAYAIYYPYDRGSYTLSSCQDQCARWAGGAKGGLCFFGNLGGSRDSIAGGGPGGYLSSFNLCAYTPPGGTVYLEGGALYNATYGTCN